MDMRVTIGYGDWIWIRPLVPIDSGAADAPDDLLRLRLKAAEPSTS